MTNRCVSDPHSALLERAHPENLFFGHVDELWEVLRGADATVQLLRIYLGVTLQSCGEHPAPSAQREVEACFQKAIEIAKAQSAKSWELRAATSLARLWQQQGRQTEAYELLSEIYNWFTEGFDTKDLQEAKALLEELGKRFGICGWSA